MFENTLSKQKPSISKEPDVSMAASENYDSFQLKERIKAVKSRARESPSQIQSENKDP